MQQNFTNRAQYNYECTTLLIVLLTADCKYAAIRQRLEISIVTKIFTTQRLTRGKIVLWLFDILGGVHCKLENYGFHEQNFDYFRF